MTYNKKLIDQEQLEAFCRKHHIRKLSFFGSVLRDNFSPDSDIDILVEFEPRERVGLRFFTIERELSELLGRKVDLNTSGFLSDHARDDIVRESRVYYDTSR